MTTLKKDYNMDDKILKDLIMQKNVPADFIDFFFSIYEKKEVKHLTRTVNRLLKKLNSDIEQIKNFTDSIACVSAMFSLEEIIKELGNDELLVNKLNELHKKYKDKATSIVVEKCEQYYNIYKMIKRRSENNDA